MDRSNNSNQHDASSMSGDHSSFLVAPEAAKPLASSRSRVNCALLGSLVVAVIGCVAGAGFVYVGVTAAQDEKQEEFDRRAAEVVQEVKGAWQDYEVAGLWIHESCRKRDFTRRDFTELYEYLRSGGLDIQGVSYIPNVTRAERAQVEREDRVFYQTHYPNAVDFHGFKGLEPDPAGGLSMQNRSQQPFYFPVRYVEPVATNAAAAGFDLYSSSSRRDTIHQALETWQPALTNRLSLVQETDPSAYSVLLMHPGVPLALSHPNLRPKDLSSMVIRMPALLQRAFRDQKEPSAMYVYDQAVEPPQFLGAIQAKDDTTLEFLPELELQELMASTKAHQEEIRAASHTWKVVVLPGDDAYEPDLALVWAAGSVIMFSSILLAICLFVNMRRVAAINEIVLKSARHDKAIVSNLFPSHVRDQLVTKDTPKLPTSENIFGSAPIADLYPEATIMFADLVGFTAWSSVREPTQVFTLLESIYYAFDSVAKARGVFKVETIGDCYVACAGLPTPRKNHARVMAKFAVDCLVKMPFLTSALEETLGPETAELALRIGMHSGPVTAGVLRGDKGRFQLFGDSMNTASRMESTGTGQMIHVSEATSKKLPHTWSTAREDVVVVKGKGPLKTYWLATSHIAGLLAGGTKSCNSVDTVLPTDDFLDIKTKRLVDWNVKSLDQILQQIVARRAANSQVHGTGGVDKNISTTTSTGLVLDEVKDIITLPKFDSMKSESSSHKTIEVDSQVTKELTDFVTVIASLYQSNPFHNFEHASHVTMSVKKLLSRIIRIDPNSIQSTKGASELHDHTFGITSDPLTQFACVFAALIHDVDHCGVPNMVLVNEKTPLAQKYGNKSILEQNSVDVAWDLLMQEEFATLRACLFQSQQDIQHFRQVVVNAVMATDIMDKELGSLRKARWEKAFADGSSSSGSDEAETSEGRDDVNRKATIVIEHLIQASDVAHTMQHWHVYRKWNERLFLEMYGAYKQGRLDKDPSVGWHQGELGFFDFYIIPLAKKLETCGVFGVSSHECLSYAQANRKEWETKGNQIVASYLEIYNDMYGSNHTVKTCVWPASFGGILDPLTSEVEV